MNKWTITVLSLLCLVLYSCEQEGPAEKAGKNIDRSVESFKNKTKDFFDDQGPAERAGEKIDEGIDNIKDKSQDLRDRMNEQLPNIQRPSSE